MAPGLMPTQLLESEGAYRAYLLQRWPFRGRSVALFAIASSPLWFLLDILYVRLLQLPWDLTTLALLRLPWVLLPVTGLFLLRWVQQVHAMPRLLLAMCALFCLANDWVFFQLGAPRTAYHMLVILVVAIAPPALLPLQRSGRVFFYALFGAGHFLLNHLAGAQSPLAERLWSDGLLGVGGFVVVLTLEPIHTSHRRSFHFREQMQQSLQALEASRAHIADAVATLANSVSQLADGARSLSEGSAQSRLQSQEMARTTEDMARAAHALGARSRAGATTADRTHDQARAVDAMLETVEAGVQDITAAVASSEERFRQLEERTHRIGSFVDMVQQIATRTQMLAINAGIEAQRAGAQGLGFGVVAREVRRLAQLSMTSGREVAAVVQELRADLAGTVESVEAVRERTARFLDVYGRTRDTLSGVQQSISATGSAMQENARDAELQAAATAELSRSTGRLRELTEAQAQLAVRVDATGQELAALAHALRDLLPRTAEAEHRREDRSAAA